MTDSIIQSQITSPMVRMLQSIPTNSDTFVHNIPDNTPPFSKTRIEVEATNKTTNPVDLNGIQVFKVPQMGYLNRVYMMYRMRGHNAQTSSWYNSPMNFAEGIEYIELRTHNNVIQRIYSEAIPFEYMSVCKTRDEKIQAIEMMSGFSSCMLDIENAELKERIPSWYVFPSQQATGSAKLKRASDTFTIGIIGNPALNTPVDTTQGVNFFTQSLDFIIPIPLSSTFYLKDNLQTRFLEDLEIHVKTRRSKNQYVGPGNLLSYLSKSNNSNKINYVDGTGPYVTNDVAFNLVQANETMDHRITMVFHYHNWHENVEQTIRNTNFKPSIPACLLSSDYMQFEGVHESSDDKLVQTSTFNISSDALITDIFIIPILKNTYISTVSHSPGRAYRFKPYSGIRFLLYSGNEIIYETSKAEADTVLANHFSTARRQHQNSGCLPNGYELYGSRIRFGFNNTDEHWDGGISLASLVNPRFVIIQEGFSASTNNEWFVWKIILKRKVLLRIDSNTGYIEKSLSS